MSATAITAAPAVTAAPEVPLSVRLLYGVGEIPLTVTMVLFGLFAMFFYNSVMKMPAVLVGIGVASGLVLDAFLDPWIGYRSDRGTHPLGRRHSFMLPGAIAMGPCFFLLLSPPRSLGPAGLFAWLLACSVVFRAVSAIYRIPYVSLGAELSQDYDERTRIIAIRSLFGLVGTLCAASLSFLLFFPATANGSDPKLQYASYPRLGLAFGAMMTVCGLAAVFGTLHRGGSGPAGAHRQHIRGFLSGFRISLKNAAFRKLWLSFTLFFLAVVLNATLSIHYFTWYVRLHEGGVLSTIQTCFYVGAMAGVILWLALARRSEKRTLYMTSTLATALLLCAAAVLFGEGRLFGAGHMLPLAAGHAIAGLFASALWVLPASMLADVSDQDALATGHRREGIYFGILNFGEKIAAGGALLVSGLLLHYFVRLAPGAVSQTQGVITRLGISYGLVPGVLLFAATALMLGYGLNRRAVHDIQTQLAAVPLNS